MHKSQGDHGLKMHYIKKRQMEPKKKLKGDNRPFEWNYTPSLFG